MKRLIWIEDVNDQHGGIKYEDPADLDRAKAADLLTLPLEIDGTNCTNCRFFSKDVCTHPQVKLPVTKRMCCAFWDNPGSLRSWSK